MTNGKLSPKQKEILEYIKSEILSRGYPPAVREICNAVHLKSTSSVHSHLETLEKKGFIRRDPTKPRAIEVIDDQFNLSRREVVSIPLVRSLTADQPYPSPENIESYFPISAEYMPENKAFMFRVGDNGMTKAGINPGDLVLVEQKADVKAGDTVAVLAGDSSAVMTVCKDNGNILLQPENEAMDPVTPGDDCKLLGKVFGVMRFFQ